MRSAAVLSLGQRARNAVGWIVGSHFVTQALRLGGNLALTRLLLPESFGLMAMVFVLMTGLALFSDLGTGQNVVQSHRGKDPVFLNTVWTVQIVRGWLISALALVVSYMLPAIARQQWLGTDTVYADPQLPWVIAVFSINAIISGFESTKLAEAKRELRLKQISQIELMSQTLSLAVMLIYAGYSRSVWALVAGALTGSLVRCVASHWVLPGCPNRLCWDREAFKEIFDFGKWVFLTSILGFIAMNGDRLLLGRLVSAKDLGLYSIASLLATTPQVLFLSLLASVAFPAFGEVLRKQSDKAPQVYFKVQMMADALLFFGAGFLFLSAETIVRILYDSRYQDAGPMLQILSIGLIGVRYQVATNYWMAAGNVKYHTLSTMAKLVALYAGLPLGFHLAGLKGALSAIVVSQFAEWPIVWFIKLRDRLFSLRHELIGVPLFLLGVGGGMVFVLAVEAFFGIND